MLQWCPWGSALSISLFLFPWCGLGSQAALPGSGGTARGRLSPSHRPGLWPQESRLEELLCPRNHSKSLSPDHTPAQESAGHAWRVTAPAGEGSSGPALSTPCHYWGYFPKGNLGFRYQRKEEVANIPNRNISQMTQCQGRPRTGPRLPETESWVSPSGPGQGARVGEARPPAGSAQCAFYSQPVLRGPKSAGWPQGAQLLHLSPRDPGSHTHKPPGPGG